MESQQQRITARYRCFRLLLGEDACDRRELELRVGILTDSHHPRVLDGGQLDAAIEERYDAALANDGSHGGVNVPPQGDDGRSNVD